MKKIVLLISAIIVIAGLCLAAGWYWGKREASYNPYTELNPYKNSRHEYLVKSAEISVKMTDRAVAALKHKHISEAIADCNVAIDLFPIDAKPYILLTKFYLMTGQEKKIYDTLARAGGSYPDFDNIMDIIDDEDLDRLPLPELQDSIYLANFPENKKSAVTFMFDDGEADVYKALPTFEKYGYRATIPVVAGFVADSDHDPFWGSWEEWKDAAARGFEIANHSMYHHDSKDMHGSDFDVSIDQAKEIIESQTGQKVTAYVFPHDSYTDESVSRALRQHEFIRTPEFMESFYDRTIGIVIGGPHVSLKTANRLVDISIKRHLWLIAKCHGVTTKRSMRSFKSITPALLDGNLAYIHSRGAEVWVDTFSHVEAYLMQRAGTKIETQGMNANAADFILHHEGGTQKSDSPLTVVIKIQDGEKLKSAETADGRKLKAWECGEDSICVDTDAYDEAIHVQWGQ